MNDYQPIWCPYIKCYCVHRPWYGLDNSNKPILPPNYSFSIDELNKYGIKGAPCLKWNGYQCMDGIL